MRAVLLLLPLFIAIHAEAIGLQHGVFRSQSTQGDTWLGSSPIVQEHFDITVYPDYLDVQLDWEFGVGGTEPAAYKNALEIVGNLNLVYNSTVIGMLVWYKGEILKAKLKTKDFARKQYEEVVDRNSPVPPRPHDPVLLEYLGNDNYDISIYPLDWGGTRKIRIRYLVPSTGGVLGYPYALSDKATVTIRPGNGVAGFNLAYSNGTMAKFSSSVEMSWVDFDLQYYNLKGLKNPQKIIPVLKEGVPGSRMYIGTFSGNHFSGQMAQIFYEIPEALLADSNADSSASFKLFASVKSKSDSCKKGIGRGGADGLQQEALRIYSKDPLIEKITWSLLKNDKPLMAVEEYPHVFQIEDGLEYARSFGASSFYPMSPSMPASLGISLGFIDQKYTLVALEEDSVGALLESKFAHSGVPALNPEDLFPAADENYQVETGVWSAQRGLNQSWLLQAVSGFYVGKPIPTDINYRLPDGIRYSVINGRLMIEIDPSFVKNGLLVSLYDLKGQLVKSWNGYSLTTGVLSWSPSEASRSPGSYILKVSMGSKFYSQQVVIR